MSQEMSIEQKIQKNAEIIRGILENNGASTAYDQAALEWLENHIEQNRDEFLADGPSAIVNMVGSFLGECLRHNYGGQWVNVDGQWAIEVGEVKAFPFNKVSKFLHGDSSDSFVSMFRTLPALMQHLEEKNARQDDSP